MTGSSSRMAAPAPFYSGSVYIIVYTETPTPTVVFVTPQLRAWAVGVGWSSASLLRDCVTWGCSEQRSQWDILICIEMNINVD